MVSLKVQTAVPAQWASHVALVTSQGCGHNNGTRHWASALKKTNAFVAQLSLDDKVGMINGNTSISICIGNIAPIPRLNFSRLCMSDGPNAVNRADLVSVFPSGLTAAATWDRDLIHQRGFPLGKEARGEGTNVLLGPSSGPMGHHALGGRNWEGFGIQENGVQTCSKHYIGNEQETQRSNTTSPDVTQIDAISSNIDDGTLHELYLWLFANAIKAGTTSIMCSYNRVNQTHARENSDFPTSFIAAPSFISLLGSSGARGCSKLFVTDPCKNPGWMKMGGNIMAPYLPPGQDSEDYPTPDPAGIYVYLIQEIGLDASRALGGNHASLIREVAAAGTVLIKNVDGTLPLKSPKVISVFRNDAADATDGLLSYGFGGGIFGPEIGTMARAREIDAQVLYITNDELAENDFRSVYPPPELCIVFQKAFASESFDRVSFELDNNSTAVINNAANHCGNTIVITHPAGVNTMPWADNPKIGAIVAAHYPGQESGSSIVDVLWGDINPSGRLPYTIPRCAEDPGPPIVNLTQPVTDLDTWQADFTEGQLIDYRHYDAQGTDPLFQFGFGFTYTTFDIAGSKLSARLVHEIMFLRHHPDTSCQVEIGGHLDLWEDIVVVQTRVTNRGDVAENAVPQLYVSFPDSTPKGTPVKVPRRFEKVYLEPGETKNVDFNVMRRYVSYWDSEEQT
ncbi:glycoside hydrolase family 3 protein [Zopfia rhizophila CBS 207.26]|uniref:Probable beta-glucosidase G n=1 Tax=Zopfia rhizophila CBS 207.26 TaxID=1314779 RepID=A0A6A6DXL0_9PEZI|nr:glycoside hydrolase family 3 protein [Zopfia rhizophila CBS 207.26]